MAINEVYEDLDAGDEARRNGDYVGFDHPDGAGTDLDSVTIPQGSVVTYDGTNLADVTGDGTDDVAGVLANYNVYGDTGKEKVKASANVKMRGEVLADLSTYVAGAATVAAGTFVDDANVVYAIEEIDADNDLWRVQVR